MQEHPAPETPDDPTDTADDTRGTGGTGLMRAREEPLVPLSELLAGPDEQRPPAVEREWPRPWMTAFLLALTMIPEVTTACDQAGVSRSAAYRYRQAMPEFAEAWDDAVASQRRLFLHNVQKWATTGLPVEETLEEYVDGKLVKRRVTRKVLRSERMAELLLRAYYPDRFRLPERVAHEGPDGGPVEVVATREEIDGAVAGFSARVVRLADARAAKAAAPVGGED